jgi:hypothetical protein
MKKVISTVFVLVFLLGVSDLYAQVDPRDSPPPTEAVVGSAPVQAGNWMIGGSVGS